MDKKQNSYYGYSGRYRHNKQDDEQKQKDTKARKSSGLPAGVDPTGITYTNGAWYFYYNKCGVNKIHTYFWHETCHKQGANFKLLTNHPFSINLNGIVDGENIQSSVTTSTTITPTMIL